MPFQTGRACRTIDRTGVDPHTVDTPTPLTGQGGLGPFPGEPMVATQPRRLTAAQIILLAGEDLLNGGVKEFNEWELTVAAWRRDPARFGLRGYEQKYPDHKRVMTEIMGRKPGNPVQSMYLEKIRPNTYRLTALGKAEVTRLRAGGTAKPPREKDPHARLAAYVGHPAFARWRNDPEQPRLWVDVADFLAA